MGDELPILYALDAGQQRDLVRDGAVWIHPVHVSAIRILQRFRFRLPRSRRGLGFSLADGREGIRSRHHAGSFDVIFLSPGCTGSDGETRPPSTARSSAFLASLPNASR